MAGQHHSRCDAVLARFADAGVDVGALAAELQTNGARAFVESWNDLMKRIAAQTASLA